jgi:biofilm PGA synthesis N-glycosyltransferase PgaC
MEQSYVLITPAKNEEGFIQRTLDSVVAQSVPPRQWVVVSDGSTDRTDEIVRSYSEKYPFVKLLRLENTGKRNFSAKVAAFRAGMAALTTNDYQFIGNLDADVSFAPDYFSRLMVKFAAREKLGLAGGLICELIGGEFQPQEIHRNSVAGAVQLFRRACFDQIGGYTPIPSGGVDAAAEIMTRMHGWQVETASDLPVQHHRRVSTGNSNVLKTRFKQGINHCVLGYHPMFQLLSSISRMKERPYVIGALLVLTGYSWAELGGRKKVLEPEVVQFLRKEQMQRVKNLGVEFTSRVKSES